MRLLTIKNIATYAGWVGAIGLVSLCAAALVACSTGGSAARPRVYDLGPGALVAPASAPAALSTLVLGEVDAPPALDGTAVLYRLGYVDVQQLRPYAQARWSMVPAQLVRQRLREHLGQQRSVLSPAQAVALQTWVLHVELEEFSQVFDTPDHSAALVRMRATISRTAGRVGTQEMVAQRGFVAQHVADAADAPAGVRAMTAAVDAVVADVGQWLNEVQARNPSASAPVVQRP